jgi:hypothetical protein
VNDGVTGRSRDFEARVCARIREFDVTALLELLRAHGYAHVTFQGSTTNCFRPTLLEAIEFVRDRADGTVPSVIITANLGLMAPQGPLPAYFDKLLDYGNIDEDMSKFLSCFDHSLLSQRFAALRPRNYQSLLPDWEKTERDLLRILDVRSPSTLDWLFRLTYPELGVIVRRRTSTQRIPVPHIRVGVSELGRSSFGGAALANFSGFTVRLVALDNHTDTGERWELAATRRLEERVLPLLEGSGMVLEVILEIDETAHSFRLNSDAHLSFDALHNDEGQSPTRRLPLYAGWLAD